MIFKKSTTMKISVNKEQEKFISTKEKIKKNCLEKNVIAFDIFENNNLIGFAMLKKLKKGKWFLWNYAIDEKYQNKGFGKKAIIELIALMKNEYNLKTITTTYITENEKAKQLYQKLGFTVTDEFDDDICKEVNMELNI